MANIATPSAGAGDDAIEPTLRGRTEIARPYGLTTQIRLLAGLLVFSLALTLALLFWSAKSQDKIAVEDSRHLTSTALSVQLSNLKKILTDYTYWDEAYQKTVETVDPDFFDENFGSGDYLRDTFGITASFVIGPDNRILRLMLDSAIVEDAQAQNFASQVEGGLGQLIEAARRTVDGEFQAAGGLVKMAGQLYFVAVRAIHPHTEDLLAKAAITPANAHVAAFMRPLDEELLDTLATDFGLRNLHHVADFDLPKGLAQPLYSADDQPLGALTWQIDLPSRDVLYVVLPALLAVVLCVGLLSWYVLNSLRRGQMVLWHAMQRAQSADQTKTEFLANMSHELRTPLNAIIGFSEMIRSEAFGSLGNERYAEYNANIHDSGRHLLDIIDDVLELSKIEAGKFVLQETEIAVPETIESIRRLIAPRAADKRITVDVKVAPNLPALYADEHALKQILLNLLSNAVKFTPSGGRVVVEAAHDTEGPLRLSVSDTGVGIPKEQISFLMEPFHQVAGPLIASEGGAGLGLPLIASLAALHGAALRVESEVGKGTAVFVDFPPGRVALPKAA